MGRVSIHTSTIIFFFMVSGISKVSQLLYSSDNGECLIKPRYSEDRAKHKFILIEALSHCLVYIEGGKSKPIWHCVLAVASASIIFQRL